MSDYEDFKLGVIMNFGIDTTITAGELDKDDVNNLSERLYEEAKTHYDHKTKMMNLQEPQREAIKMRPDTVSSPEKPDNP